MSMLTNPPHVVTVQNRVPERSAHGTVLVPDGPPVDVSCTVRAVSAKEENIDGLTAVTLRRIMARAWPGDIRSLITYMGVEWETVGDPQWFDGSVNTQHWEVRMRRTDGERS